MIPRLLAPAASLDWLWNTYVVGLHATAFLAAVAALAWTARGSSAAARSRIWALGLLGTLAVSVLCYLPGGWVAGVVPAGVAAPMVELGAVRMAVGGHDDAAAGAGGWAVVVRAVWLAGVLLVLLRLGWGWLAIRELSRGARPVWAAEWLALLEETRAELGIRRAVELRRSAALAAPLTWGTRHPVVLLPAHADGWPAEHRRAVLLHELAHVRRLDCLVQVLGQVACALWWFHPAVWWVAGRLQVTREQACDARVLRAGVPRADYAECLLRIADLARSDPAAGAVAVSVGMARPSRLRERLHSVLDPALRGAEPSRVATTAVAALGLALVLALGTVRLTPHPSALVGRLASPDGATRAYATLLLLTSGDPEVVAATRARMAGDPDARVRELVQRLGAARTAR